MFLFSSRLGLLCLSGGWLCAEGPSRGESDSIEPDRQLVYNVEGLT